MGYVKEYQTTLATSQTNPHNKNSHCYNKFWIDINTHITLDKVDFFLKSNKTFYRRVRTKNTDCLTSLADDSVTVLQTSQSSFKLEQEFLGNK